MKLLSKITYSGNNNIVVWKHPSTFFDTNVELIVPYTHEAILIKDGLALGSYRAGKHILSHNSAVTRGLFRKREQQSCEVYYVNNSLNLPIKWGTSSQLDLFDPMLEIPVRIGANGEFNIKIANPRKFLFKVVGNQTSVTKDYIQEFFRDKMAMYIKNAIANTMLKENISFYEVSSKLKDLSNAIKDELVSEFDEYGTSLQSFMISGMVIPEEIKNTLEQAFLEKAKERISNNQYVDRNKEKMKEKNTQQEKVRNNSEEIPLVDNKHINDLIEEEEIYVET